MSSEKEVIIDLKDLLAYVIKRWYYLIIIPLIFSIIVGGYKAVSFDLSENNRYSEENREALVNVLTESEVKEVENLFSRYLAYRNSISYNETYLGNSILMKLNPDKLPSLVVQYSVSSDQQNLLSSFTNQTLGINEYEKISAVFGDDTDTSFISELISISGSEPDKDGISVSIDNKNNFYTGSVNNVYKWMLNLNVLASSETQCKEIMTIIEDAVQVEYLNLLNAGIDVSIVKVGSNYTENASKWLADHQRVLISEASSLKSEYDSFEKKELDELSSIEKNYFTFLKDSYEGKEERSHALKYTVIGGMLAFLVVLAFIVLGYLYGNRIKNKDDYLYRVNTDNVLGIIYSVVKHKSILNRYINRIVNKVFYGIDKQYNPLEKASIVSKRIRKMCNEEASNKIYIVNDSNNQEALSLLDIIVDLLKKEGIEVYCGKPLLVSKDFEEFEKSKLVVYFGCFYDSKAESLSDYLKLFNENKARIIGSVLTNTL